MQQPPPGRPLQPLHPQAEFGLELKSPALEFQKRLQQGANQLRESGLYVGTSSWKYEGWLDLFYSPARYAWRGKVARKRFEDQCLSEYAEVFPAVGLDATFYQFPTREFLGRLVSQVPPDFKFGFKVTHDITQKHFPEVAQSGSRAGQPNPSFLNAGLFRENFLKPCAEFPGNVGVFIFEFSAFNEKDYARGRDFVEDLDKFLAALPQGWSYAVELRNPTFLQPEYFAMLARHKVAHVFNQWARTLPIRAQVDLLPDSFPADFMVSRLLLANGRNYQAAVDKFSPYRDIQEPNPEARSAVLKLIDEVRRATGRPSFIFVNNRFEGNALRTIEALFEAGRNRPN
jgi:uncharacterized protein YecE (DUF72 family)